MKKNILILYHKNCPDGFGGAWAAWKKFGNKAEYIAVDPEKLPEKFPKGKNIYAVDISYPISVQKKLRAKNKSLVILDHHVSRKSDTEAFVENIFDNDHSGSVLAWKYFHTKKKIPGLLSHIEDVDIWRWKLKNSREIISMLQLEKYDFKKWDDFVKKIEGHKTKKKIIEKGKSINSYEDELVRRAVEGATLVKLQQYKVLSANSPFLNSYIGKALCVAHPHFSIVWSESKGRIHVSLRSDGFVDVSKIAKKYGGGGHKRSAGFFISNKSKIPWKIIKK